MVEERQNSVFRFMGISLGKMTNSIKIIKVARMQIKMNKFHGLEPTGWSDINEEMKTICTMARYARGK